MNILNSISIVILSVALTLTLLEGRKERSELSVRLESLEANKK